MGRSPVVNPTAEQVRIALEDVHDAHIPASLNSMGMLAGVSVNNTVAHIEVCVPCMGCPAVSAMVDQVRTRVLKVPGITAVEVTAGEHLFWDRDLVHESTRTLMRTNGIQI